MLAIAHACSDSRRRVRACQWPRHPSRASPGSRSAPTHHNSQPASPQPETELEPQRPHDALFERPHGGHSGSHASPPLPAGAAAARSADVQPVVSPSPSQVCSLVSRTGACVDDA